MKKILVLTLLAVTAQLAVAQKFSIKGQVVDSLSNAMPSATIMLMNPKDSSLVNFGLSDSKGFFEIRNVNKGEYDLKISFLGYAPYIKRVQAEGTSPVIEIGELKLQPAAKQLNEMVIMGERVPVRIKGDTIEFNASSFKTKANANVEDLLKKLPGVEVDPDGTVRAQGEEVKRVLVDGKEFFGRDPKLATRNLPADAIEKVQVFDKKSDQSQFTGIEDGQREKTVNLELKEDRKNGMFGNVTAGAGTEGRYMGKANINRFRKDQQLSFLGMGNNTNEQGFSMTDFMNFTGGSQQMMSGGGGAMRITFDGNNTSGVPMNFGGRQNGILKNYAGGLNFNKDLSKKTQLSSNYFYSHINQNVSKVTDEISYLSEGKTRLLDEVSRQISTSNSHKANLTLDHNLDSANSLKFTNNFSFTDSEQDASADTEVTFDDNGNETITGTNRDTYSAQTNISLNSSLLWRHRFHKKGRTLSTNVTLGLSKVDGDGEIANEYSDGLDFYQTNTQETENQSYGTSLSYTEPLGGRKYLEANYNFRTNRNESDQRTFDDTGIVVDSLTNQYSSNYIYNRPGLNFRLNRQKFSLTVGASYQMTSLKGDLISDNTKIERTFENILPVVRFNYDFSGFNHFRMDYETSMQEPSIQQLSPVITYSNPLNLSTGNSDLEPAYNHRLSLNYTTFDPARFINFFAFVTATYTSNAIANSQTNDGPQRTTKPVNVDNATNLNGNFNFGFPIKPLNSRFNLGPTASLTNSVNLIDGAENSIKKSTLGGSVRYNYTYKEILTIDLSANLSHQETLYEFNTPDQVFFNETYTSEANLTVLKNYQLNGVFEYLKYTSKTNDFSQAIPLLNVYLSRFILKNNSGELKIGVNNLLDKSLSVTQTATDNSLRQETTNNLGRYYMVSFTYAINKHLNPMGGGRRGGVRMMMNR